MLARCSASSLLEDRFDYFDDTAQHIRIVSNGTGDRDFTGSIGRHPLLINVAA